MREPQIMADAGGAKHRTHLVLVLLAFVITGRTALAQTLPLQATDAEVTDDGSLQYSLTNSASQPATAWSVAVMASDQNGQVMRHFAITTDEYRAEAERGIAPIEEANRSLLRPHQPRRFVVAGPFDAKLQLTITPMAAIFIDGSSAGHSRLIDSIFQRRAAERDARHDILRELRDVQAHYAGLSALKEAIARLARSPTTPDPDRARQTVVRCLREALARAATEGFDPARALADETDVVRREYEAAVQHSVRRKES